MRKRNVNSKLININIVFKASKRQPGASGRLHRTVTGEWVWSSEEEGDHSSDEEVSICYASFSMLTVKFWLKL